MSLLVEESLFSETLHFMFLKTCDIMSNEERTLEDESENIHVLCQLPEYVSCLRKEIIFFRHKPEAIRLLPQEPSTEQDCPVQKIFVRGDLSREKDTSRESYVDIMNKIVWDKFVLRTNLTGNKARVTNSINSRLKFEEIILRNGRFRQKIVVIS